MPRFKEQAICIRHLDWSQTSQIVVLLTQERGKLRGLAKGSKRSSPGAVARFSGGIELLTLGQVVAMTKPSAELATITEWDLQQPYHHLRKSLDAQLLAMYAADVSNAMLADDDPHPASFHALAELLADLAIAHTRQHALLRFQWTLLTDCGYLPRLDRDARSGQTLPVRAYYGFDAQAGGLIVATDDTRRDKHVWRVRRETVELLRKVRQDAPIAEVSEELCLRANRLLCVNMRAILDRQLPTMNQILGK